MPTDGELLSQYAKARSEESFAELGRRHGSMVLASCRRLVGQEAEDAAQAVFILLARKAGKLSGEGEIGPWLYRACGFVARAMQRERLRRQTREKEAAEMIQAVRPAGAPEGASREEVERHLDAALAELPERFRRVVVLCHLEGVTQEEAARRLGVPLSTVANRSARALEKLREKLSRRKVELGSAAALGALLLEGTAKAAEAFSASQFLPSALASSKLAASGAAAAAPGLSWSLAEGAVRMMFWAKMTKVAAGVLAAGVVIGCAAAPMALHASRASRPAVQIVGMWVVEPPPTEPITATAAPVKARPDYDPYDLVLRLRCTKVTADKDARRCTFEVAKVLKGDDQLVQGPIKVSAPVDQPDRLRYELGDGEVGSMTLDKEKEGLFATLKPGNELDVALNITETTTFNLSGWETIYSTEYGHFYVREEHGKLAEIKHAALGQPLKAGSMELKDCGWSSFEEKKGVDQLSPATIGALRALDAERKRKSEELWGAYRKYEADKGASEQVASAVHTYQDASAKLDKAVQTALEEALGDSAERPLSVVVTLGKDGTIATLTLKGKCELRHAVSFALGQIVADPTLHNKPIDIRAEDKTPEELAKLLADQVGGRVVKKGGKWHIEPALAKPIKPEQF